MIVLGFPGGSDGKESTCNTGDLGLISVSGRCPREGNGYPLQYSCLENSMDRGAWWATVHGVEKTWTRLINYTFTIGGQALLVAQIVKNSPVKKEARVQFRGWEDPLKEGMATRSSILAWRTP